MHLDSTTPAKSCLCGCGTPVRRNHRFVQGHHQRIIGLKRTKSLEARFWAKVNKTDGCWWWTGAPSKSGGYGTIHSKTADGQIRDTRAHRVSYELHYGPIPDGLDVLHRCNHALCVRPDHLYLGTDLENVHDTIQAGHHRFPIGEAQWMAKLTAADVLAIRERFAAGGVTKSALARAYGISVSQARNIITHRKWRHI